MSSDYQLKKRSQSSIYKRWNERKVWVKIWVVGAGAIPCPVMFATRCCSNIAQVRYDVTLTLTSSKKALVAIGSHLALKPTNFFSRKKNRYVFFVRYSFL